MINNVQGSRGSGYARFSAISSSINSEQVCYSVNKIKYCLRSAWQNVFLFIISNYHIKLTMPMCWLSVLLSISSVVSIKTKVFPFAEHRNIHGDIQFNFYYIWYNFRGRFPANSNKRNSILCMKLTLFLKMIIVCSK